MSRDTYVPGAAFGADIEKEGESWTLVMVRELRHPPQRVWEALTDPEQLRAWSPFDADRNLGTAGTKATLTTVGAPYASETTVKRAEVAKLLELNWGDQNLRWELEARGGGTRLTLWAKIDRRYIAMGAAGWHVCFDVLDRHLAGEPIPRIAGPAAMKFEGWQRLHGEYAKQFKVETPGWT